ncbi:Lrp/AsnC family transcriptional regulator [Candidatus Woesearchaeota archaeon]|nr:Lrp/AsnC family transcriptional regulator [Candidatus Woesearchaeota archaeon]
MAKLDFIGQIKEYSFEKKLIKLDLIDRKILYILENNVRFSPTTIGRLLLISREKVSYRIKRMEEIDFVHGYAAMLDPKKLGFHQYRVYFKFKNLDNDQDIIAFLFNFTEVTTIVTCSGSYDLQFVLSVRNQMEFIDKFGKIVEKYSSILEKFEVLDVVEEDIFVLWMILHEDDVKKVKIVGEHKGSTFQKEFLKKKNLNHKINNNMNEKINLDDKDLSILDILKLDSTSNIKHISHKISLAPISIEHRIKDMILAGVIKRFFIQYSPTQLGYQWWHILFKMKNLDHERFTEFIKNHPNMSWYMRFLGKWDYQCNVYARTNAEFHAILQQIRKEFADHIMYYDTFIMFNQLKYYQKVK